jgi:hypothetical protein
MDRRSDDATRSTFAQQYRLTLNKSFFPNLNLIGGGSSKSDRDLNSAGQESTSADTKTSPSST